MGFLTFLSAVRPANAIAVRHQSHRAVLPFSDEPRRKRNTPENVVQGPRRQQPDRWSQLVRLQQMLAQAMRQLLLGRDWAEEFRWPWAP